MAQVIEFNSISSNVINVNTLRTNRQLKSGMIAPAEVTTEQEIVSEHTSEPIKNIDDIYKITHYLIKHERYRDNMLFIVGINFGLRVSDLLKLRFSHLINSNLTFKDTFPILEQKTANTRKRKKNRYITINEAVMDAVELYLVHTDNVSLSDYMFQSESNHGKYTGNAMSRSGVDKVLKGIAQDLNLNMHMSTHTLRKTFAYWQLAMSNNDPRKLMLLSKMLGHSSVAITLDYIGLTGDEIAEAYRTFNLGSDKYRYIKGCSIGEEDIVYNVI